MTEYLDPTEVRTLTASCRVPTQANWLKEHGIPHRLDGRRLKISRRKVCRFESGPGHHRFFAMVFVTRSASRSASVRE